MKKTINVILGVSFLIFLSLIIWINYLMSNNVGDIEFDSKIDDPSFIPCNEDQIFQYYSVGTTYIGERKAIREEILAELADKDPEFDSKSGYITFRFIVNCTGQTGRYRVKMVDENLSKTDFKKSEIDKLKNSLMQLKTWMAGVLKNGNPVDSYYQINFKIIDGKIVDIF